MNWYVDVLKKYAVFEGRARRKEYWMFFLVNFIISFVLGFAGGLIGGPLRVLSSVYFLAVLVPSIAVGVRRLHDNNRPGWWLIVPIANLIFLCIDSDPGTNNYGPSPKSFFAASPAV